jgi:hypothetical protein
MTFEPLKDYFLTKIKERDFSDFIGTDLSFHVPVSTSFLNFIFNTQIVNSPGMRDIESVEFSELHDDQFKIKLDHSLINKNLNCSLHEMGTTRHGQPVLTIEFIGGLKRFERTILNALFFLRKGWGWLKSKTADDNTTLPAIRNPVFEVTGTHLAINMSEFLRMQGLDVLIPLIKWERLSTKNDMLILDFRLKV